MASKNFLDYIPDLALRNSVQAKTCTVNLAEYFLICTADIQNGDVLTIPPGDYYTTRGIELESLSDIEVTAYGATIICHPDVPSATKFNYMDTVEHAVTNTFGLRIVSCSNVSIQGLALNGNAYLIPHDAWPMTGYILNSQDTVLYDCSRHNCKGMLKISGACVRCGTVNWNEYNNHWGHSGAKHIGFREFTGTGANDLLAESDLISLENNPNYLNRHILIEITYSGTSVDDPARYRWSDNSTATPIIWYGTDPNIGDSFPCTSIRTSIPGSQPIQDITIPGPFVSWETVYNKPIGDKWWFTFIYSCQSRFAFNAKDLFTGEQHVGLNNFHRNFKWSGGNQNIPNCRGQEGFIYDGIISYPASPSEGLDLKYLMPANGTETLNAYGNKSVTVRNSTTAGIDFLDIEELEITNLRVLPNPWCGISLWATHAGLCYKNVVISNVLITNINDAYDGNRWDYTIGVPFAFSQAPSNQFMVYHCGIALSGHGTFDNVNINNIHIDQSGVDESSLPYRTIGLAPVPFSSTFHINNLSIDTISCSNNVQTLVYSDWLPYWDHSNKTLSVTSAESSTFQSSFTLRGTCNNTTDYLLVSHNEQKTFIITPYQNQWEIYFPRLNLGTNNIFIKAVNILTGQYVTSVYFIVYTQAIADQDDIISAIPFIMTETGLKLAYPVTRIGNKLLPIRVKVAVMSSAATPSSITNTFSIGLPKSVITRNTALPLGLELTAVLGEAQGTEVVLAIPSSNELLVELNTNGIYLPQEGIDMFTAVPSSIDTELALGIASAYQHTPADYTLTNELRILVTDNLTWGEIIYTAPFAVTRVHLEEIYHDMWIKLYDIQDIQLVSKAWYSGGWVDLPSTSAYLRMQIRAYSGAPVVAKIDQITY